jgi:hypothetical protein
METLSDGYDAPNADSVLWDRYNYPLSYPPGQCAGEELEKGVVLYK